MHDARIGPVLGIAIVLCLALAAAAGAVERCVLAELFTGTPG
jgi:hypothetical protein